MVKLWHYFYYYNKMIEVIGVEGWKFSREILSLSLGNPSKMSQTVKWIILFGSHWARGSRIIKRRFRNGISLEENGERHAALRNILWEREGWKEIDSELFNSDN